MTINSAVISESSQAPKGVCVIQVDRCGIFFENGVIKSILVVSGGGLPLVLSPEEADEFCFDV